MDAREAAIEADEKARFSGSVRARPPEVAKAGKKCYILTSAQNNTHRHAKLWDNLKAYAKHKRAKILVSRFKYNMDAYPRREWKSDTGPNRLVRQSEYDDSHYDPVLEKHGFYDKPLMITPHLMFCGEVNIIPTADKPLSGFENYTGRASGIFPHARQHMQSIPALDAAKFNYTTGCVTQRNYIQRKAGLKAEYHHAYGALIVEVDSDGDFFVRQLRATEDGAFQDLDVIVSDGKVMPGHRVEAIQWGDIHVAQMNPEIKEVNWGGGGIADTLKPRYQFLHDTLDFKSRNHHEMKDPHEMFKKYVEGMDNVRVELEQVAEFLRVTAPRPDCKLIVVDSNHDQALTRWLREAALQADPSNAIIYLKLQIKVYEAILKGNDEYHLFADVMKSMEVPREVRFLLPDESYVLCKQAGGIECGMHGHAGANGARGTPNTFARVGRRANIGHTHSAGIVGDLFVAGTCSNLRLSYNRGLSSWSHSHIVVYPNGCRAIISCWKGKWRG